LEPDVRPAQRETSLTRVRADDFHFVPRRARVSTHLFCADDFAADEWGLEWFGHDRDREDER
jgi:hypothetical protein